MRTVVPVFDVMSPDIDEKVFRQTSASARTSAVAIAKGRAIVSRLREPAIVITADTVVAMPDGTIREKPESSSDVRIWLRSYLEHSPRCVTAVYGIRSTDGLDVLAVDSATIAFSKFSPLRIDAIIKDGTAMGCAGAFTMEHPLFADHVRQVWGNPETIQGLPSPFVQAHLFVLNRR